MATAFNPTTAARKPIASKGLFSSTGGQTYENWKASATPDSVMPSIAPQQVDDSVINAVNKVTSQDSPLMQAARTEGLKIANSRGLMNSSIAAGTSQDAMMRYAVPIGSQEAAQDFQRNQAARAFEYGMAAQDSQQDFQAGQTAAERDLQRELQSGELAARRELTLAQIASTEGMASAEREMQERMQSASIDATKQAQIRDIASREGLAAAERALQQAMQEREIGYQTAERLLDRQLQERIAGWNLDSSDRNAAAQFLYNMETLYNSSVNNIMANQNLSAKDRETQLTAARNMRDRQLDFVQQMYGVSIDWGQNDPADEDEDSGRGSGGGSGKNK